MSGSDLEDAVVQAVGNVERSRSIHADAVGLIEFHPSRGSAGAAGPAFAAAGHRNYSAPIRKIFANHVVVRVGDDYIVARIHAQVLGFAETGFQGLPAVAVEAFGARSGHRATSSVPIHPPQ